ncbi:MAG: TraB/GumN family protein [Methanomassiliicoccaceae archaeon]|jgi:pheromone shutdown protein TraB|nr:TraB/GumN family protein [Methanomassiliicoccaceae archaeon]
MMITLLGVGHVFRIAEPVAFIVKNIWPDAVLVELDQKRYDAMTSAERPGASEGDDRPPALKKTANTQMKMAEAHGAQLGAELLAAIETGRTIGAFVELIDVDASRMMQDAWKEMPFLEKMRFGFSAMGDKIRPKKRVDRVHQRYSDNEEEYFAWMRKKYPTLVRKVIDERDIHMAGKINEASEKYDNIVVVIGDGHIDGISKLLTGKSIRKIRLKTLMDTESMNALRAELWSGRTAEENE